jgi:glyoxylase-like metal-dependent hydrolase (beta-lactamase superfamily II)
MRRLAPYVVTCVLTLATTAASPPAGQQRAARTPVDVVARDSGATMERIADGVYAIIHRDATHDWPSGALNWPHGNTGVVVGDDGVLVVDATYFPSRAAADIALIRAVTDRPVRWLVNTHWHGDHTHGNAVYRDAFPGLTIVGQRANRDYIAVNQDSWPHRVTAPESPQRKTLASWEATRARGADSTGRRLSESELRALDRAIAEQREEIAELAKVRVAPPTLLFDDSLTIFLGVRRVDVRGYGHANSPEDVVVYLPAERVLFTGDIVVHPVPFAFQSYPVPWIGVLRSIEAIPASAIVPGHGPVFHDHAYLDRVLALLDTTKARVERQFREGKSLVQAAAAVDLSDLRPGFVTPGDVNAAAIWDESIKGALPERMAACVQGQRC